MSIATVVTAGFGNGTFNGTIPFVVTRGYSIGLALGPTPKFRTVFIPAENRTVKIPGAL